MILAQAFSRFVFDLDGVIWRGTQPIAGAADTVRALRDAGKRVCFVTNNSSATRAQYAAKLEAMGAGGSEDEIVSSADATAHLLHRSVPGMRGRLALVVGGEGLIEAVLSTGARIADEAEAADASVVVVGLDPGLTYDKLRAAVLAIQRGATFVASNVDPTYPAADGLWPGAGSIVAAIRAATAVAPMVAGKPEPTVLHVAAERLEGSPALVIGDRVDTDVAAARAAGWPSALVLTGVTGVPELAAAPEWPDIVIRRLPELLEDRPHVRTRPAVGADLPYIASMLHAGGLISGAARERLGRTVVAEAERKTIATAAWEQFDGAALLRSVAVDEGYRKGGAGTLVVAAALRRILESGCSEVYLVTESAERFFAACGFVTIDREQIPSAIAAHPQVQRECPTSAPAMRLRFPQSSSS